MLPPTYSSAGISQGFAGSFAGESHRSPDRVKVLEANLPNGTVTCKQDVVAA